MEIMPGDIILLVQPKRAWYTWVLVTIIQVFKFFVLKRGLIDIVDKYYHIELGYGLGMVFTEEPPYARITGAPKAQLKIYRLKNKPTDFNDIFFAYVAEHRGLKFDYVKFWQLVLDAMFKTDRFSKGKYRPGGDVCAENVSAFYKEKLGIVCSTKEPESSIPNDVNEYCENNTVIFENVLP